MKKKYILIDYSIHNIYTLYTLLYVSVPISHFGSLFLVNTIPCVKILQLVIKNNYNFNMTFRGAPSSKNNNDISLKNTAYLLQNG